MDEALAAGGSKEHGGCAMIMPHLPDVTGLTHSMGMIVHRRCLALVHAPR
ncbi:hypothetical protein [Paraburkholderia phenoliruptrix]